jgi:hypothetical protein
MTSDCIPHQVSGLGVYAGWCYVITSFVFDPQPQADVDSGRAHVLFPDDI